MEAAPFFMENFSRQEEKKFTHNTVYFHAVTYPLRWPPKLWLPQDSIYSPPSNKRSPPLPLECVFVNKSPHSAKRPYSNILY